MNYLKSLLFACLLLSGTFAMSQDLSQYQYKTFIREGDTLRYRLLLPANYNPRKSYPLIVFLHGAGERGYDNNAQLLHGGEMFLRDSIRKKYPAIVIFPQCPPDQTWAPMKVERDSSGKVKFDLSADLPPTKPMTLLFGLVDSLSHSKNVNTRKIYVGGLSLGGMGTFYMITRQPNIFAAAFPICGAGNSKEADRFAKTVPVWIFHGGDDKVVPVEASRAYDRELRALGAKVKYTEYPGVGHNSWDNVFVEPGLMSWLFSQTKIDPKK